MTDILIDFETCSELDLAEVGAASYMAHPSTRWLCCAYCINGGEIHLLRPGDPIPSVFSDSGIRVGAWNVDFDLAVWNDVARFPRVPYAQTFDLMVQAAAQALPRRLESCARALDLSVKKDTEGHRLMLRMCKPVKPTMRDSNPWRHHTQDALDRLAEYCRVDMEVERMIYNMPRFKGGLSPASENIRQVNRRMNQRGLCLDMHALRVSQQIVDDALANANDRMALVTRGCVTTVNEIGNLRAWIGSRWVHPESLDAASVSALMERPEVPDDVYEALALRKESGQSSVAKIPAMLASQHNGRLMDTMVLFGADTGRWSSRGVQIQNFPRGHWQSKTAMIDAFDMLHLGLTDTYASFSSYYGAEHVLSTMSGMLRGFIVPSPGSMLAVVDYSQVEARVSAWYAGETAILSAFASKKDLYREVAAIIYGVDVSQVTGDQRFVGKQAVLGLSYGMGAQRFMDTCAKYGVSIGKDLADRVVAVYRRTYTQIVSCWRELESSAMGAVRHPRARVAACNGKVVFASDGVNLYVQLPSKRLLTYNNARIQMKESAFGDKPALFYDGVDSQSKTWVSFDIWGGTWLQQITQAASFDLTADAFMKCEAHGHAPVATVHDELIAEVSCDTDIDAFMRHTVLDLPVWASDIPVGSEGWIGTRYRK